MDKGKKKRKIKIALSILISGAVIVAASLSLFFWNSSYTIQKVKLSSQLINKLSKSQNQNIVLELNSEELNEIIGMYFKKEQSFGAFNIKGIHAEVLNNKLSFYIPVDYKGVSVLISSTGTLSYSNKKVEYSPEFFKAGKINLPKGLFLKELKSRLPKGIYVESNGISIDSTMFPLGIKSVEVKNDKVAISLEKYSSLLEGNLKSIGNKITAALGIINSNTSSVGSQAINSIGTTALNSSKNSTENSSSTSSSSTSSSANPTSSSNNSKSSQGNSSEVNKSRGNLSEFDSTLNRISGGLNAAMGDVSTGGQRAVISELISAVNSMKGNVNANPYAAAGSVRATYKNLTPEEKSGVKAALFSNVNGSDINTISGMMGK